MQKISTPWTIYVVTLLAVAVTGCQPLPDFHYISSHRSPSNALDFDVYGHADGGERRLTSTPTIEEHPVVSRDRRLFFSGYPQPTAPGATREIFALAPNGGGLSQITTSGSGFEGNSHVFLAPDELTLFVTSHRADGTSVIRRFSLTGADQGVVVDHGAQVGHSPAATTPDGDRIYYSSNADGDFELYRSNLDGSGEEKLTDNGVYDAGATPSPDGTRVAFTRGDPVDPCTTQLWVMAHDGADPVQVTSSADKGFKWAFGWRDASTVRYASNETGDNRIYTIAVDGGGKTLVVDGARDDQHLLPDALCGFPGPDLHLEATPLVGPPGTTIGFTLDTGGESFKDYTWTFGDGSPQQVTEEPETSHLYSRSGTHAVTVTARDNCTPPNERVADLPVVRISGHRKPYG